MKKIILVLFILLAPAIYAQNKSYVVYLGCYTNGDTIPDGVLENVRNLNLLKDGKGQKEAWINTWKILVYNKGKFVTIKQFPTSPTIVDQKNLMRATGDLRPQKIVIEGLEISIKQNDQIIKQKLPPQTFYRAKASVKKCPH